jgi:hypothetical protein
VPDASLDVWRRARFGRTETTPYDNGERPTV